MNINAATDPQYLVSLIEGEIEKATPRETRRTLESMLLTKDSD